MSNNIIIEDIDPQFQPDWLPAIGEYKPVWHNPAQKDPDQITEYVHTERPEYILLKNVDDQGSGDFSWQVHKVLSGDALKNFVNDPRWDTQWSDQLTVFSKVPWAWRMKGIGKEDVPCFACAANPQGGVIQIQTAVTTNRFDLTFNNPQVQDPYDNSAPVANYDVPPYSGHAWSYNWNCSDPCSMTVDGVNELNWANGNIPVGTKSPNDTGGSAPFPTIWNRLDFISFAMLWNFQVMPADEALAADIYMGPCFPPAGGYPGVVPPTHIQSNEPDYFGNPNVNAGPWMKTESPNRSSPAKLTYWRMEIEHFGPMLWAYQGELDSGLKPHLWDELKKSVNYVRPDTLAPDEEDPNKPLDVPLDCFRFSLTGFSHYSQQYGFTNLPVPTTLTDPPPSDVVINDTPLTIPEIPKPKIEIIGPPKTVVSTSTGTWGDPGVNILDDNGNVIDTVTSDDEVDLSSPGLYFVDYTWCYMNLVPQRYADLGAVQAWLLQNYLNPVGYVGDEEDQSIAKYPVYNMSASQISSLTQGEVTDAGYYGIYNYTDDHVSVEPAVQSASGLWTFDFAGFCSTVTREVLVTEDVNIPSFTLDGNGDVVGLDGDGSNLTLVNEDGTTLVGDPVPGTPVCVIDSKGRVQCVMPEDVVRAPINGPMNMEVLGAVPFPVPQEGPLSLTATIPVAPLGGPENLSANAQLNPLVGPTNLSASPIPSSITNSPMYKGYVFDPRTSSVSGPFISEGITAITTKDNSSEMYAVNEFHQIIKTEVTDLNDTYFEPVADPFTDLTTPLSGRGVIMSEKGNGFMYRNRYKATPFSESQLGYGAVEDPLYFKNAYLSIAETNWLHLGDEHNEKQVHRVDLRFHKNSCGHLFLYVQNDDGKVKGQYKGALKEHMKVFTNLRGRGFKICMMIVAHKDHPWAMREMAVGHLYGKSF